jgi:hypothetical protein
VALGFFHRYVIGSPGDVDPELPSRWLDYESSYAQDHDDLDAIVYLGAGAAEHDPKYEPETRRLGELLLGRNHPGLRLKTVIFPEDTHFPSRR